jgi:hypothetical protein
MNALGEMGKGSAAEEKPEKRQSQQFDRDPDQVKQEGGIAKIRTCDEPSIR